MKRTAAAMIAATMVISGCHKSTAESPDANAKDTNNAKGITGPISSTAVVPVEKMAAIKLPVPQGAPANGHWDQVLSLTDGDRSENYMVGDKFWLSLRILDCNLPRVKEVAKLPVDQRGDYAFCLRSTPPTSKLGAYEMYTPGSRVRVVMPGHLSVIVSIGADGDEKLTSADLEAFLMSLNPDELARL